MNAGVPLHGLQKFLIQRTYTVYIQLPVGQILPGHRRLKLLQRQRQPFFGGKTADEYRFVYGGVRLPLTGEGQGIIDIAAIGDAGLLGRLAGGFAQPDDRPSLSRYCWKVFR